MNIEAIKVWVDALRSGKYVQGSGILKSVNENGEACHCALGVIVEEYNKLHSNKLEEVSLPQHDIGCIGFIDYAQYNIGHTPDAKCAQYYNVLPPSVANWLGMPCGGIRIKNNIDFIDSEIWQLNDDRISFDEIATIIENEVLNEIP